MILKGVELSGKIPLDAGANADVWKGLLGGKDIAVKVLRIKHGKDKYMKVGYLSRNHDDDAIINARTRQSPPKLLFGDNYII
jgi:hypothetical protein